MKGSADVVILVGEKITKPIKEGLKEVKFDSKNIYVVKVLKKHLHLLKVYLVEKKLTA